MTESVFVIVSSSGLYDREIVARPPAAAGDFPVPQKVQIGSGLMAIIQKILEIVTRFDTNINKHTHTHHLRNTVYQSR